MTDDGTMQSPDGDVIRSLCDEARDLIKRVEGTSVQQVVVRAGKYEINIDRRPRPTPIIAGGAGISAASSSVPAETIAPPPGSPGQESISSAPPVDTRHPIVAPLVGTFYRSGQPGAKPFVEEGDIVDKGQTLCIVEAMKIMNQVTADIGGRVSEILLKDGDWVEFQQVLLYLEPIGAG